MAVIASAELALARNLWPDPPGEDEAAFSSIMARSIRALVQQGSDIAGLSKGGATKVFILLEMNKHLKVWIYQQ